MLKLDMEALAVDSFPTEQEPADSQVAMMMMVAQYPMSFGWDCISCAPECARWVDTV